MCTRFDWASNSAASITTTRGLNFHDSAIAFATGMLAGTGKGKLRTGPE